MYSWEREKLQKKHKYPSFSTTLLDEIYRSIDGFDEKQEDFEVHRQRNRSSSSGRHGCPKVIKTVRLGEHNNVDDDEDVVSFRRACLIEKWMEQKVSDKVMTRGTKPPPSSSLSDFDSDPLFFSSSSSDSSSGALSSSSSLSETEFLDSTRKSSSLRTSCFNSSKPKPVRTRVEKPEKMGHENLIKSKSAALKMYANLKKMKQPISPGARLTNFLNSLFANGKPKTTVKTSSEDPKPPQPSTSASRSCLNKTPRINNGVKRTVRFDPVGVIVDEDCRPCGHKRIYDRDYAAGKSPAPELQEIKKTQGISRGIAHYHQWKNDFYTNEEEDDDKLSDCSSDLFEIDHLALFGNRRFREELPVYETTHLDTNRAIASGFIR